MPTTTLRLSAQISASAETIYQAWLSTREHSAFTGSKATIAPRVGGKFSVWDGYITGVTIELEEGRRIVQTWRTTEFPKRAPDSTLEVLLEPLAPNKSRLTLVHKGLPPDDAAKYKDGWTEFYFDPLKKYFKAQSTQTRKPAPKSNTTHGKTAKQSAKKSGNTHRAAKDTARKTAARKPTARPLGAKRGAKKATPNASTSRTTASNTPKKSRARKTPAKKTSSR